MNSLPQRALVLATVAFLSVVGLSSQAAAALPAYKVTLATSASSSTANHFITVSGTVYGAQSAGHAVTIQRHYVGGTWVTVASATVHSDGRYSARVETPRGGTTSFRAVKGSSSVRSMGVSATRSIPVYRWLYLSDQPGQGSNSIRGVDETINSKHYRHSIEFFGNGYVDFKLAGLCTIASTAVAYLANSAGAPAADATLGSQTWGGSMPGTPMTMTVTSGSPMTVNFNEAGTQFREIDASNVVSGYRMVLGDPKAYCNADVLPPWLNSEID